MTGSFCLKHNAKLMGRKGEMRESRNSESCLKLWRMSSLGTLPCSESEMRRLLMAWCFSYDLFQPPRCRTGEGGLRFGLDFSKAIERYKDGANGDDSVGLCYVSI